LAPASLFSADWIDYRTEGLWTLSGLRCSARFFCYSSGWQSAAIGWYHGGNDMSAIYVIGAVVAVLLLGYLVYALVKAEDF
jgi:K+-transporting ATPase KdpF subunit